MRKTTKKQKGFSLIELLVVVAIILIIAAIAIPALLQARRAANEAAAVGNVRSLASAEFTYASRNNQRFATMANMNGQGYTDSRFSTSPTGTVSGFIYTENYAVLQIPAGVSTVVPDGFGLLATHQGTAADYDFCVAPDGVVRYGPAFPPTQAAGNPVGR